MGWPFVTRAAYEALAADRERIRGERDQFLKDRNAAQKAAKTADRQLAEVEDKRRRLARWLADAEAANRRLTEQLAAVSIVNGCLTDDLTKAKAAEQDDAGQQALEAKVADLKKRLARAQADVVSLSAELAEVRGNRRLVEGGNARSRTDAAELRRLREQARLLDERVVELQQSHVADTRELHDLRQNGATS